ncbi:FCD domain-containing protein [Kribbella qitaiheensis]|uniref:FCD domain-containing protein n=1 Tax=Kribbella qitaiheensis TaxID=1544730 RepID=UPI00362112B4
MVTVGLLYPGHSAEDDYPALEARLDGAVQLPVVITSVGEVDIAFHEHLVHLAGSPRLSRMHQTFITETRMCIHAALEETYSASEVRGEEHRALAEAIKTGDPALVDHLLTAHMDDAITRLTIR